MSNAHNDIIAWLDHWARCIRERDFDQGLQLFDPEASGFGTITLQTKSLEELLEQQWKPVWLQTEGFAFDDETMVINISPDRLHACVHALWRSRRSNSEDAERLGRATILLTRQQADDSWKCRHTHFSMWPDTADTIIKDSAK